MPEQDGRIQGIVIVDDSPQPSTIYFGPGEIGVYERAIRRPLGEPRLLAYAWFDNPRDREDPEIQVLKRLCRRL